MWEFCVIWFESSQRWIVMFPNGNIIDGGFGAIGHALAKAYDYLELGESDFECTEDTGTFYRFEKLY